VIAEGTSSELKATLGATIVEVGFDDDAHARQAQTALCEIGLCDIEATSHTVQLKVDDGARVVLQVVRVLDEARLEPTTLNIREPTLDDVFLTLTGHKAEEENGAAVESNARGAA
jgi:ABC-2 type transport system ATP-binding protein